MFKLNSHKFHLVAPSCLPSVTGFSAFLLVSSIVFYWNTTSDNHFLNIIDSYVLHLALFMFSTTIISWLIMVVYESGQGFHTKIVRRGLRYGVILFIVSEIMFFFSLFWAFFHFSLSPSIEIGHMWPPLEVQAINVWGLPFTNTVLLLSSGVTITLAHHYITKTNNVFNSTKFIIHLTATIVLGMTFLGCQWIEYTYGLRFRWNDHVYGSIFFIATGFHGFHVLLGTYGLLFCLVRSLITMSSLNFIESLAKIFKSLNSPIYVLIENVQTNLMLFKFTSSHHIGFEAALWYWHFVDVVWIFLFCTVYWWGCL